MKHVVTPALFGAFAILAMSPATAHAKASILDAELSANVALTTDYVFRGISQSDEGPAIQGGFDLTHETGFYLGTWASNVDYNGADDTSIEVDVYGGYSGAFANGLNYDLGIIQYLYPGAKNTSDYDFTEISAALGYDFYYFALSASVNYSPDYFGGSGDAFYYSTAVDIPVAENFTLSGHLGYQTIDNNSAFGAPDYMDWSVGLNYNWEGYDFNLQYIDTDMSNAECADGCDSRLVFTTSTSF